MRPRKRCSRPRGSGRSKGCPSSHAPGWSRWRRAASPTSSAARTARRRREDRTAASVPADAFVAPAADAELLADRDDTLTLLFLCCHPALSPASQLALTLRAVGGLTTAQIAAAFLVPEATMAQRISRAKQTIKAGDVAFTLPPESERTERLGVVLHVLYLIFNEGYSTTSGPELQRAELTGEAIRLTRAVRDLLPDDGEVAGLLALMLLTDARRRRARPIRRHVGATRGAGPDAVGPRGDRGRRRAHQRALSHAPIGPYQLQAAIAAVHCEAARADDTDWGEIVDALRTARADRGLSSSTCTRRADRSKRRSAR